MGVYFAFLCDDHIYKVHTRLKINFKNKIEFFCNFEILISEKRKINLTKIDFF
jgi:hypothetical protein